MMPERERGSVMLGLGALALLALADPRAALPMVAAVAAFCILALLLRLWRS